MTQFDPIVKRVVAEQDEMLRELNLAPEVRQELRAFLHDTRRNWPRWVAVAALAAAALVVALHFHSSTLTYTAGTSRNNASVGSWLAAPANSELALHFSDRSSVTLGRASHARVVDLRAREVKLLLENGHVSVTVIHNKNRNWHLRAGPFDVAVTGTRFDVGWSPEREQFFVHTLEGRVEVSGEQFGARAVSAGETLRAERLDGRWRFTETDVPASQPSAIAANSASAAESAQTSAVEPSNPPPALGVKHTLPSPAMPSWRELVAAGQYRAALEQAENDGFEGLCQRSNLSDLLALSEAARFAGREDRARLALTSLRERFRGEAAASVATFTLGRMAFDSSRDYLGAGKWFRAYLAEQPGGSLAREAAGRLVEALERGGDHRGAQIAARDYVARYPDGPQKRFVQQVLNK
jgi:TolA-binding protein